jgi:pyruvate ferredoxin oxidoreductase alpha subunit
VVLEKTFAVGIGGILSTDVRTAFAGINIQAYTVIAGLGGRPITKTSLHELFEKAGRDDLVPLTFLDLDWTVVNKQLARERLKRRSGPAAENILRDVNSIAVHIS